jgi:hypothetical protein
MPAIVGHTITIWTQFSYRPERDADGFLAMPFKDPEGWKRPEEGERLIDHLRDQWVHAERDNCHMPFPTSDVIMHLNGWLSFTVRCIAHEGDIETIDKLLEHARTGWLYEDGSGPNRVQHTTLDFDND